MNSRLRNLTVFLLLTLILSSLALAATTPTPAEKEASLRTLAEQMMRGEPMTPEEKMIALPYYKELIRNQSPEPPATDLVGGPDGFGYRFIDSQEQGGPVFNWVDISTTGTVLPAFANYDDATQTIPLGTFSFPFYGTTVDATTGLMISTNGNLQIGTTASTVYSNGTLPTTNLNAMSLCLFWDDLQVDNAANQFVYYQNMNDGRFIVSYHNSHLGNSTSPIDMQVILHATGEIVFQYGASNDVTNTSNTATIGIQGAQTGMNFLTYNGTSNTSPASLAIRFYQLGQATNPVPGNAATGVPLNVVLSWTAAPAATAYNVLLDTVNPPVTVVATGITTTSYTPTALAPNTTYYWQVIATNGTLTNPSEIWSFTTGTGSAPIAPSAGAIQTATMTSLSIAWSDNSNDETGFAIHRSLDGVNYTWLADASPNTTTYTDNTLTPNVHAWYRVFAVGAGGTSTGYAAADGWTLANVPDAPTVGAVSHNTIQITVNNSSTLPNSANTQYALYETTTSMYVQSSGALGTNATWGALRTVTVTGLTSGVSYTFEAKARNGAAVETVFGPTVTQATNDVHAGGPDGGGYRYRDQIATGGPTFNWITPSGGATTVTGWTSTDDGSAGPFNIGFNFTWYDSTYTLWYAGTNGRIQFGAADPFSYSQAALPIVNFPGGLYFWQGDMSVSSTVVQYENLTAPNRLVITYTNLRNLGNTYGLDAQIIIYETGEVITQFGPQTGTPAFLFSGIQSHQGTSFLTYPLMPTVNTAIMYFTLGAPTSPIPTNGLTNVPTNSTLSWTAGAGATGYDVYFGTDNPPATMVSSNQTGTTYNPGTLTASTTYYWRVVSLMGTLSNSSPVWSFTTGAGSAPNAPTAAQFTSATTNSITFSFTDNSTDETAFPLYKSTDGANFTFVADLPAVAGTGIRSATISELTAASRNWARIFATGAGGQSLNYAEANDWTLAAIPGAPTIDTLTHNMMRVTITNNATNPNSATAQYALYDSTTAQYVQADGSLGADPMWGVLRTVTVVGLTSGASYTFKAKARNGANVESEFGPSVTGTTRDINFGGPDANGYYYRTSNYAGGPTYSWVDISTTGTALALSGDDATAPLQLGTFVFPYYGATYSNCIVSTNGNIQFSTTGSANYTNGNLPTANLPGTTLMFMWDDLQLDADTHWIKYQDMGDGRFIISFYLRDRNFNAAGYRNFNVQVILYSTGRIVYQYGAATGGDPAYATGTIGIQGAQTGNSFLQYGSNAEAMPAEGLAIEFTTDLGAHGFATGLVTRANGAAVENAHVQFVPGYNATTDATGHWFLELPSGVYPVRVWADCFGSVTTHDTVRIVEGDTTEMADTVYQALVTSNVTSLEFQVPAGESRSQTIILSNPGDYQLEYATRVQYNVGDRVMTVPTENVKLFQRTTVSSTMRSTPSKPGEKEQTLTSTPEQYTTNKRWANQSLPSNPPAIDQHWGPDGYGYEANDNLEAGFPTWLTYTDVRGIGTVVLTDDDNILSSSLDNFTFRYYGQNYTSAIFSTNGYIQFDPTGSNWAGGTLPNTSLLNGVFAYWRDIVTSVTKYYDQTTNRFIVQWDGVHYNTTDSVHFQMQLFGSNNAIVFFYNTIPATGTPTVGIQNADGTNNRYIACFNNAAPTNGWAGYAVAFTDMSPGGGGGWQRWAVVDPASGIVVPNGTAELFLQVTMPDTATSGSVYSASVRITTSICTTLTIPFTSTVVSAPEEVTGLPREYKLHQNYPNPFNPTTEIRFDLKNAGITKLTVYNMLGQQVGTLVNGYLPAGYHSVRFEAKSIAAGVYFYRIESGNFTSLKKMVLVK